MKRVIFGECEINQKEIKIMKTLEFKGMGWDKCEGTNDVGNPRIRAQFFNPKGKEFFVEFIKNSKGLKIILWI